VRSRGLVAVLGGAATVLTLAACGSGNGSDDNANVPDPGQQTQPVWTQILAPSYQWNVDRACVNGDGDLHLREQ
jgi:hypothetical protein